MVVSHHGDTEIIFHSERETKNIQYVFEFFVKKPAASPASEIRYSATHVALIATRFLEELRLL